MSNYTLNPDSILIIMDWLNPEPGDETAALKHQTRLLIDDLRSQLAALTIWKWDVQAVGAALGLRAGDNIRASILPGITAIKQELAAQSLELERLRRYRLDDHSEVDSVREHISALRDIAADDPDQIALTRVDYTVLADTMEYFLGHHDECHQPAANYELLLAKLAGTPTNHGDCPVAKKLDEQAGKIAGQQAARTFRRADVQNVHREMTTFLGRPFTSHATDAVVILLGHIAQLERAIEVTADGRVAVVQNDDGETWIYLVVNGLDDEPWSGPYPTAAAAALAGLDEMDGLEKEQSK